MPLYSPINQYRGVNAHLHSTFQAHGGWSSLHTNLIGAIARALNYMLPTGFVVDVEQSLQIRAVHPDTGERLRRPEPDLTIYRYREDVVIAGASSGAAALVQPIPETFDLSDDLYYSAVVIYRADADALLGRPVTRIEVLSPTNKQGEGYIQYREKRYAALKSGVALVEIDLLHETPPVIRGVPIYPHEAGSHPYRITISDPTPTFETGEARTFGFDVDTPIPPIIVPLGAGSEVEFDLNSIYDETFASLTAYSRRADYEAPPEHFERYSAADQARIQAVMARVRAELSPSDSG